MRFPEEEYEDYILRLQTSPSPKEEVYHLKVFEPGCKDPLFHGAYTQLWEAKLTGDRFALQEARCYTSRQELLEAEFQNRVKTYTISYGDEDTKIYRCPVIGWRTVL